MADDNELIQPILSAEQMEIAATFGTPRSVPSGEVLFRPGDRSHDLYIVRSGLIAILDRTDGAEDLVIVHGPGTIVGEFDLLSGQASFLEGRALLDSEVQAVPPADVRRLLDSQAELGDIVLATLVARREALLERVSSSLRMVGHRHSPSTLRLREFLARNRIPHEWVDHPDAIAQILEERCLDDADLPIAFTAGHTLLSTTPTDLADRLGLTFEASRSDSPVDVTIVGAGPAGLAAAVYAASEGLDTLVVESTAPGGQAGASARIENYLGFPRGLSGSDLTDRALTQALKFGARFLTPCDVLAIHPGGDLITVHLSNDTSLLTKTVIAATGAHYRRLDIENLNRFEGRGVYYSATAVEARLVADQAVLVVGGGNSAGQAALFLARHCASVTLAVRGDSLSANMSSYLARRIAAHSGIEVLTGTQVTALYGDRSLESVQLTSPDEWWTIEVPALFSFIGASPANAWLLSNASTDRAGFVRSGSSSDNHERIREPLPYETNIAGVFVVGDLRSGSTKRVASAVGDGAEVIKSIHQYLAHEPPPALPAQV
jgi:thioredoxin reductase (NADPH)